MIKRVKVWKPRLHEQLEVLREKGTVYNLYAHSGLARKNQTRSTKMPQSGRYGTYHKRTTFY